MIPRRFSALILVICLSFLPSCAQKADPNRSIEKIQKDVVSMPVAQLESHAAAYAAAIRAQKAEIAKIQQQIQKMPVDKMFSDKTLTRNIADIGRRAEALFDRYRIYVTAFQAKGGDLSKVQIESGPTKTKGASQ